MKIKGAMTVLNNECEFLGKSLDELLSTPIEILRETSPFKVMEAVTVYEKSLEDFRVKSTNVLAADNSYTGPNIAYNGKLL